MNTKRIKTFLFLALSLLVVGASMTAYAVTDSSSVNATYYTGGSALGHVNGRDTGAFHYLTSGRSVVLNITRTTASNGAHVGLYRKSSPANFLDAYYGDVSTFGDGSRTFSRKTDASGSYYLLFAGGRAATTISVSGTLHD